MARQNKTTVENRGTIDLGAKVMVSDPCYGLGTWCQGIIENVLPGRYNCFVEFVDEDDWGIRVSAIEVAHVDYNRNELPEQREKFEVGVDSGQAGIFDYNYYTNRHSDASQSKHVDEEWYGRCCDKTYHHVKNPEYKPFDCKVSMDEDPLQHIKEWDAYMDSIQSQRYISKLDGDTIDSLGLVSSSGYGDGGYDCYTYRNADGNVVAIRVEFISDRYDDDEENEEE